MKNQAHAGLDKIIEVKLSTVAESENYIKENGPYDLIFLDHAKEKYCPDF